MIISGTLVKALANAMRVVSVSSILATLTILWYLSIHGLLNCCLVFLHFVVRTVWTQIDRLTSSRTDERGMEKEIPFGPEVFPGLGIEISMKC